MTDEEIRLLVADGYGWSPLHHNERDADADVWYHPKGGRSLRWHDLGRIHRGLPHYPTDLNAMQEVEKSLTDEEWEKYALWLGPLTTQRSRAYISASARTRAEAYLRMKGTWRE